MIPDNKKQDRAKLLSDVLFYILTFLAFLLFFYHIHPLVTFDSDDWEYLITGQGIYPSLAYWNPSKILPASLQMLSGSFAAYIIYPLMGDYISALLFSQASIVSAFITLYILSFGRYLENRFRVSTICNYLLIVLFVLFHFLILRVAPTLNQHLFFAPDCTCYYHYTIPTLLGASMVFWLMQHNPNKEKLSTVRYALLAIATYFAVFSSLYSVIVIVVYVSATLLMDLIQTNFKQSKWLSTYLRDHVYQFIVLGLWMVTLWFEGNGNRANSYGYLYAPFMQFVKAAYKHFLSTRFNVCFVVIALFALIAAKLYHFKHDKQRLFYVGRTQIVLLISLVASVIYLILLSSRVDPVYMNRSCVILAYAFFLLLLVISAIAYLCSKLQIARIVLPCLLIFVFFEINTQDSTFRDVQSGFNVTAQFCLTTSRDMVKQVQEANAAGQDTAYVFVPKYKTPDNWPQSIYTSENFGYTLYKHNIIDRRIYTKFITAELQNNLLQDNTDETLLSEEETIE